ncbi:MAG: hypothetical protein HYS22_06620 [Deltaproteobacteria bacterium]|nr:hypothetical protein [Deltaproteobacteria bacterium]
MAHNLYPYFAELQKIPSTRKLKRSRVYSKVRPELEKLLNSVDVGLFAKNEDGKTQGPYRAVAWNLERGIRYDGIEKVLKEHPLLKGGDLYFIPETDWGMARSQNRHIARDLAQSLRLNYFFAPSYLNLCKGSGLEAEAEGENTVGLHGISILSRYPIKNPRTVALKNAKDKFKGKEKRLGHKRIPVCDVELPAGTVTVACVHLDAHSSQRQRACQMKTILKALRDNPYPVLVGGDWNTSTYNSRRATYAIVGFWRRVFMGTGHVISNHYQHPDHWFERKLFRGLEKEGFNYKDFNQNGGGTIHYHVDDIRAYKNLKDWIPQWCFRFIEWSLRGHNGECPFKLDWFAGKGLRPANPGIVGNLTHNGYKLSDHDPIVVGFTL